MGAGDHLPVSGHKRHYDPAYAKKIKEGGKRAREIHEKTTAEHKAKDIPQAEENLLKDLADL